MPYKKEMDSYGVEFDLKIEQLQHYVKLQNIQYNFLENFCSIFHSPNKTRDSLYNLTT